MTRPLLALILWAGLSAGSTPSAAQVRSPAVPVLTPAQWLEDVRYFARELPRRHKNAFHTATRAQFDSAVAALETAIPTLQGHEVVVRLMQITAMIGDGHTGVHLPLSFTFYPLAVFWYGDELRVNAAEPAYRAALGAKVVKINGMPLRDVVARVKTVVSRAENQWYEMGTSQAMLVSVQVLHALGVVRDLGPATWTFEDDAGRQFDVALTPISYDAQSPPRYVSAAAVPLFARGHPGAAFWYAFLPDSHTLYVNFRRYDSVEVHARDLFAFIDAHHVTRLVIDLRQNGGGDFTKVRRSILPRIIDRPAINTRGHLFVIIGRHTFSAAMANAVDFRKETQALLVGEPIGERPNSYSENDEMTLPHSRVIFSYSTRYYQFVADDVPAVMPDQRIDPTWADFRAGRDAVLEWILAQKE